jgi:alkyl sulfatase BDS1-like metallo-beta-lactamase superfamily hydrolase
VIYTHSHADHFGGVKGIVSQEEVDQGKVKIIAPAGFTQAAIEENVMVGNAMGRRAIYMYGVHLVPGPMGQVSTGLGLATSTGEVTLILPTDLVTQTGQEMMIDGVRFVFLMAPDSEAPAEMLFFLPDFKALCAAEDATHTMHNIYTLRGAKIRDAKAWAMYLNQAIEMFGANTEVVFAQHHWPMWGQERIGDYLEKQRDMYKYIHDQTVRLANEGYTMLEIGEKIVLPESLAKQWYNRGYYGSLNHNVKSVYNFYLGWFSGNPSALHPLPEVEASKKYVEYMGGEEAILKRARQDYSKGQYRWVAEVLNHLVFANPNHKIARDLLADTLEQMGYQAENATWRNFFLTGAKELRSNDKVSATLRPGSRDVVAVMPTEDFLDYLAVHLNGPKAAQHPMNLHFNLNDKNERYLLQIKNGVLNYFPAKTSDQVDFTLSLNRSDFNALMTHAKTAKDLIRDKQLSIEGDQKVLEIFLTLFDHFDPSFNIILPRQDEGVYQKN